METTLPKITEWISHEEKHGHVSYSASQGHICDVLNCEINQSPRSMFPLLFFVNIQRKLKKEKLS
jgi:hypothetical protein